MAGLRYVDDDTTPGIRRVGPRRRLRYVDPAGKVIRDRHVLGRIRALVIPPAWRSVWISPQAHGHLQATGRDARGRKQYRYHPRWRTVRDEVKYGRLLAFARALPRIRARIDADLKGGGLSRTRVLAAVVQLLEKTLIRVGNEEYARQNQSFGLTTMRDRHATIAGATVRFEFRGKSGVGHAVGHARSAARANRQGLPRFAGYELFQYVDENGACQVIDSADVNAYLREISGDDFTAKDFRTWAGTVMAAEALAQVRRFASHAEAKRNIVAAIESVARRLGNTEPSVASPTSTPRSSRPIWTAPRSPPARKPLSSASSSNDCAGKGVGSHLPILPLEVAESANDSRPLYNRAMRKMRSVGRNVLRKEGVAKVTGAARYIDDLTFPGLLYGRTIRSTIPAGEIAGIRLNFDTAGFTIVDYRDVPGRNIVALIEDDQPCLVEREIAPRRRADPAAGARRSRTAARRRRPDRLSRLGAELRCRRLSRDVQDHRDRQGRRRRRLRRGGSHRRRRISRRPSGAALHRAERRHRRAGRRRQRRRLRVDAVSRTTCTAPQSAAGSAGRQACASSRRKPAAVSAARKNIRR